MGKEGKVVVDTNVFVGAGFNPDSHSGTVVQAVRDGRLRMPWTGSTRHEAKSVLGQIPPLDWSDVEGLFREEDRIDREPDEGGLGWVHHDSDRKFAALARETGATLISNDDDVLADRSAADFPVLTPGEYVEREL